MTPASTRRLTLPFTTWFGMRGRVTAGADGRHVAEVGWLHLLWILAAALRSRAALPASRPPLRGLSCAVGLAVTHQAAWEALAEAWVVRHEGRSYARGGISRQIFFWTVTLTLASAVFRCRRRGDGRLGRARGRGLRPRALGRSRMR